MAGKSNTLSKKTIIAIIAIIILLIIAGFSVGLFLADKGSTEAVDGGETVGQSEQPGEDAQTPVDEENNDGEQQPGEQESEEPTTPEQPGEETPEAPVDNEEQPENPNEQQAGNAGETNTEITTGTDVNEVGETTVTRVEEVARDYWDWWMPASVVVASTTANIDATTPNFDVIKETITEAGENVVYAGEKITYKITVKNNGTQDLNEIEISDRIPENTTYVVPETTPENLTEVKENGEVIGLKWIVTVPAGEEAVVEFTVIVDEATEEAVIRNTAIANGEESNETATAIITSEKSSVITRDDKEVEIAKVGDLITYKITVKNTMTSGEAELLEEKYAVKDILDTVPAGTEFVSAQEGANVSTQDGVTTIKWENVEIKPGEEASREFTVRVTNIDGEIKNIATVGGDETNEDETPTADIKVEKTVSDIKRNGESIGLDTKVQAGDVIEYNIVVTNTGSVDLTNVVVDEELEGIEVNAEDLQIGDLSAGESKTIIATYTVTHEKDIQGKPEQVVYNKVVVTGETPVDPEEPTTPEEVEDEDDEETPVEETPGINIEKEATAVNGKPITETTKVRPGDVVEYTITVQNTGNTTLENIVVTDSLKVTVNGEIKEIDETTKVSTIATIASLAPDAQPVEIKAYYTVTENDTANLEKIYNVATATVPEGPSDEDDDETVVVNEDTSVSITKIWNDNNNQDGIRPEQITINLYADGTLVKTETINGTEYTFEKLPTYNADGSRIVYTVSEETVPGYQTSYSQDTLTITNTHTPAEIQSLVVTKKWEDNNNQDGIRPTSVSISLKANDVVIRTVDVTNATNWVISFENLPVYENGKEIDYTVVENNVPETYKSEVTGSVEDGFVITNTHEVEKTSVSVEKVWNDEDNQDGIRPEKVSVSLMNGDTVVETAELSETNSWKYTFTNLDKKANGVDIDYKVVENDVPETYESVVSGDKINGFVITNTHEVYKTSVNVTKVWQDNNNQDGIRPESVSVSLKNGDTVVSTVELNEANSWKYTFTGLDKYADGKEIEYKVVENDVPETYESEITGSVTAGYIITNTHEVEKTSIDVEKIWDDEDNQDGIRPEKVSVTLLANGTEKETVELNTTNNWKYTFTNLDVNANGQKIIYTLVEANVDGYSANITGDAKNGFTVTNTHNTEVRAITVTKSWADANNQDGMRPLSVELTLYADGEAVETVTVNESTNWSYTFNNLPVNKDGKAINYTVDELNVPNGYDKDVDKFVVTNTHEVEKTSVKVTKVWNDNDNQDGIRPKEISVSLMNGATVVATQTLSEANDWTYTFANLDKNANGEEINYTVVENSTLTGYTSNTTGDKETGFIITNTHEVEKTSVSVEKIWNDKNNQDGIRPQSVSVSLLANGTVKETVELNATNSWKYTFANLDKKANGQLITYAVVENDVPETYESVISGDATNGYKITNTHEVEKTSVTVTKSWLDNENQDGIRPESISVSLMNGETVVATQTLSNSNNWTYTFTNLDKKANGVDIEYTVVENSVKTGYTSTTTGDKENGFVITNTHEVEKTSVSVEKVWNDASNQDGMRPDSVSVSLMNGTTVVDTQVLSQTNNWKYTFANLDKKANGQVIDYTVVENDVPAGYSVEVTGNKETGYVITNTHTPETINIPVTKVWEDNDNYYNARKTITVDVKVGDTVKQTIELTQGNGWTNTFTNLPKYSNGQEITYVVSERPVEGYTTKSIVKDEITEIYTITNTYNNVTINKKTLTSVETQKAKVDVVFVLDTSSSMQGNNATTMNNALNSAMKKILENPNNRVGVVGYSDDWYGDSNSTVLLPLNHYTAKYGGNYINLSGRGDNTTLTTNVNELGWRQNSRRVRGATYTQIGVKEGAELLTSSSNTDIKDRIPVIILLTDGEPTRYTTRYSNVGNYTNGDGQANSINEYGAYYNIMTARHYKAKINEKYATEENPNIAKFFTIGIGMDENDAYQTTLLNPTVKNVTDCKNARRNTNARDLYELLKDNYRANGGTGTFDNNLGYYSYADGSYIGQMSETELNRILNEIITSIKHYETTTSTTTNINTDPAMVELENLDVNEKITIVLDGTSQEYTLQQLTGVVTQERGRYYINLNAEMFNNVRTIDITYYEEA